MLDEKTTRWIAPLALAGCLLVAVGGCRMGGGDGVRNEGIIVGGGRFHLVIESGRTSVEGTHFLVDSATGDLWLLAPGGSEAGTWQRLASGPQDVAALVAGDLFGRSGGEIAEEAGDSGSD